MILLFRMFQQYDLPQNSVKSRYQTIFGQPHM